MAGLVDYLPAVLLGAFGGAFAAGLLVLYVHEHQARLRLERRLAEIQDERAQIQRELANLTRVARNRLYRECLEDKQAQAVQAALRLRVAKRDLEDALAILDVPAGKTVKGAKE